ncbi:MAG: 23S rRNA (guanosine(2251)-2'-O)-methyltransferase RlmB [Actinomycetota bacterium]|nr:23S rRNA (guanosine(2251)-2'-O)-methyltransferase RlmB [Euzebyaceae bacterium]MDQ3451748.1 23S rRNA (guanosine(2251)-2'-O)-methyltransferase RlmB [Actinomycetota bacterium]
MHAIPGRQPVAEALRAGRQLHAVTVDRRAGADLEALLSQARQAGVTVRRGDRDDLDQLAGGVRHQGVVATAPPYPYRGLAELGESDLLVVLDGVTDPQNLGAIARSAEAAGAGGLVLRERRSAGVTPAAEKAAAGALSWLPVVMVPNIVRALADLTERGFWSVGLSGAGEMALWDCGLLDGKVAITIGGEGDGLSRLVAQRVDQLVCIPMSGNIESLNASAAAAVALFEVARRKSSSRVR